MQKNNKNIIWISIVVLLILGIIAFYLYEVFYLRIPYTRHLFRAIAAICVLLASLLRVVRPTRRKSLQYYEKIYEDVLGYAFNSQPAQRKKLLFACRLYDESNYNKALKYLFGLLEEAEFDRDSIPILWFIGLCFTKVHLNDEAIHAYYRLLQIDPKNARVHSNLGYLFIEEGDFESALKHYNISIELKPENYYAYVNRANYYFRINEYDNAIGDAKQALELKNNGIEAASLLTIIYALTGDEESKKHYYHIALTSGKNPEELNRAINYYLSEQNIPSEYKKMRNFILGTDWWTDCDDAVALRIIARAHKAGEICLKGVGINACMEYSVSSLEGFLNSERMRNVPIGIDLAATDFGGNPSYQQRLSALKERYSCNEDAEGAARLYRRILAEAKEPVEIMEIGFLQVIADVLKSEPDDLSPLNGIELVKEKVSKIWVMAGKWDEPEGKEHNFARNARARAAAAYFCKACPVPVTFLGWEIGWDVVTGGILQEGDVLRQVLVDHKSFNGRCSWDPMLVLLAIIGDEKTAGYDTVRGCASVDPESGVNHFEIDENGPHAYVVKTKSNEYYVDQIHQRIL